MIDLGLSDDPLKDWRKHRPYMPVTVLPRDYPSSSLVLENDTNLVLPGPIPRRTFRYLYDLQTCHRESLGCLTPSPPFDMTDRVLVGFLNPQALASTTPLQRVGTSHSSKGAQITCSPFSFNVHLLAYLFQLLSLLTPRSIFCQARVCLLSLCLAVLPVCAHSHNVKLRTSMCCALACRKSHLRLWVTRGFQWYMCG